MYLVFYLLAFLLICLNVADWRLTRAIIVSGRGYEANPVMAWLIDGLGLNTALLCKVLVVAAFALWLASVMAMSAPLAVVLLLLALNGLYVWVVLNNYRVMHP